ncbi:MAG TPA: oligosaccharyl transferase, archaeosortase A system-associated, partial [Methanomicrobiales archaeon]|nr:oligosaccharyl transferase, archaeosortase A system-associated [Methanomicrobiales archaeon]
MLSILTFWIRVLPALTVGNQDVLNFIAMDDPFYNLRLVEQMLHNGFVYPWFDPMSQYPVGSPVNWGPMMTYITTAVAIVMGASTRPEIAFAALLAPPLLAAAMVPVMYFIGKTLSGWKTGLVGAVLVSIVSGQYFYRSLFGYLDHHIAEALFSAIFALGYIYTLSYTRKNPVDLHKLETLKMPALLAGITGVLYLLGLFTMPTMILFALIVTIFTVVQFLVDHWRGRGSDDLLLINAIVFAIASVGLAAFGIKASGLSVIQYSLGHVVAYVALIGITAVLYVLSTYLKGRNKAYFPLSLIAIAVIGTLALVALFPSISSTYIGGLYQFFGQPATALTVQEAMPWSLASAWATFNYGLILMFVGIGALAYQNWKENRPETIFAIVWSVIILVSTIQHVRYEYYLAVNVAMLSALGIGLFLDGGFQDSLRFIRRALTSNSHSEEKAAEPPSVHASKKHKKEQKVATSSSDRPNYAKVGAFFGIAALAILFATTSGYTNYTRASLGGIQMNPDWKETLEWMQNGTPATGVDYNALYDKVYDQSTFQYPQGSYGVMSWWD